MMEQKEKFNDWLFRYQYVYRLRRTEKSKKRFLTALVTDISEMREDVQVIEYDRKKKYASRNVYVGDIEKADRVICTYYDTPPQSVGSYVFFDRQEQGKRTMKFIFLTALLMITIGVIGTLIYMNTVSAPFDITSIQTILFVIIFGIYFYFLGKVTQGLSNRKTLVRNTSSVVTLLAMISELENRKLAFAFIDEGSYGEKGLDSLRQSVGKNTKIFYLDSIGAQAPLHFIGNGISQKKTAALEIDHQLSDAGTNYIISAQKDTNAGNFYLDKETLNQKALNMENIMKVVALFKK